MCCMPKSAVPDPVTLSLRDRTLVVVLVVAVHASLLWSWAALPALSRPVHHEMSVSMDMRSPDIPSPAQVAEPAPAPLAQPRSAKPTVQAEKHAAPVETSTPPAAASTAPAQPVNTAPGLPDREPDYRAAYLNNPPPAYPMAARRMGWQGRVVLNVEVLATGLPGQIAVQQSSGHQVLDDAALQAVRGWRFVAARQGGQVVSQRFLVPIPFILKEAE